MTNDILIEIINSARNFEDTNHNLEGVLISGVDGTPPEETCGEDWDKISFPSPAEEAQRHLLDTTWNGLHHNRRRTTEKFITARKDALTDLFNRRGLDDFIRYEQKRLDNGKSIGGIAIAMDMTRLKSINDTYGHEAGDTAIRIFAEALKNNLRSTDAIARQGGDEFMVIMRDTSENNDVMQRIDDLNKQIREISFEWNGIELNVGARIGVAAYSETVTILESIQTADHREAFIRDKLPVPKDQRQARPA